MIALPLPSVSAKVTFGGLAMLTLTPVAGSTAGVRAAKVAAGVAAVKVIGAAPVGAVTVGAAPPPPAAAPPSAGAAAVVSPPPPPPSHPAKATASKLAAAKLIQWHKDRFLLDRSEYFTTAPLRVDVK